jgi:hypothetical protein
LAVASEIPGGRDLLEPQALLERVEQLGLARRERVGRLGARASGRSRRAAAHRGERRPQARHRVPAGR